MIENAKLFSLTGSEFYITEQENDAFRVREGHVLVYIIPLRTEGLGRRSFLYEAVEGEVIPSFVYQDMEHCKWRFCFAALERAVVEQIENGSTAKLRECFARKAKIKNYKIEGYYGGLVDKYQMNLVAEDSFILRSQRERKEAAEKVQQLIADTEKKKMPWIRRGKSVASVKAKSLATNHKYIGKGECVFAAGIILCHVVLGVVISLLVYKIYKECIVNREKENLFNLGISLMAAAVLSSIVFSIRTYFLEGIRERGTGTIQRMVYNRLFFLPGKSVKKYNTADLAVRIFSVGKRIGAAESVSIRMKMAITEGVLFAAGMVLYSIKPALLGIAFGVVYVICCAWLEEYLKRYKHEAERLEKEAESRLFHFINGIIGIRSSGTEDRALYEYMKPYVRLQETKVNYRRGTDFKTVWYVFVCGISLILCCMLYVKEQKTGQDGMVAAFVVLYGYFMAAMREIADSSSKSRNQDIDNVIQMLEEVTEEKTECDLQKALEGKIEVQEVTFSYSKEQPVVLDNINISIRKGEYIGIVGSSGCGKTTLLRLLLGLEQPDCGKIYYDGVSMEQLNQQQLRKQMGVVLQDDKLISGSIYENITFMFPGTAMEQVNRVVQEVGLEKEIQNLPMGMYTLLNEDSRVISAGQCQQILLARALLSKPAVLFLDEATASLDTVSEQKVCETLKKLAATKIVVAHRLSTVRDCDRIIVLESGRVAEQGTYQELMEAKGVFYHLADRQLVSENNVTK